MSLNDEIRAVVERRRAEIEEVRRSLRAPTDEERRWIKRLERTLKAQPKTLRAVAGSTVRIYLDAAEHGRDVDHGNNCGCNECLTVRYYDERELDAADAADRAREADLEDRAEED